jgi:hypothetical protein
MNEWTVMNKRNVLNVEGKLKVIRGIDIGKKESQHVLKIQSCKFCDPNDL